MNQSLLILADFVPQDLTNVQTIGLQEIDIEKLFKTTLENKSAVTYLYINPDISELFAGLLKSIKVIKAGGGIVKNGHGEYLFIHRLGKWDLPKGKVEDNEKVKSAAKREVEEECGLKIDYVGDKAINTYHAYLMKGKVVLKDTAWYEMGVNKSPDLTPQKEEDIDKAEWLPLNKLKKVEENTYPLILDLTKMIKRG